MSQEIIFFTIEGVQISDLVPWQLIPVLGALVLGPFLLIPVFKKSSDETTGKRPLVAGVIVLTVLGGGLFYWDKLTLQDQKDALALGRVETISGLYEGPVWADYTLVRQSQGIRVSSQQYLPPGGILGSWSNIVVPQDAVLGQKVSVLVADGRYLKVTLQ